VRLESLRDVRPAHSALAEAGYVPESLEGVPAILTERLDGASAARLGQSLATHHLTAQSVIPLWEDAEGA
jgi:hypothetical protein